MRVFMICPAMVATGGTELLHQFSKCLSDAGVENYMVYPNADKINCPTPPSFLKYGVKYVSTYVDASDSIFVLPETQIHLADICKKGTVMAWWLSVANYIREYQDMIEENPDIFNLKERENVVHFVQSYYAKEFVNTYFNKDECYDLKDYINDEIMDYAFRNKECFKRENVCLYNPKKGYEVIKPIMDACRKDIVWKPLSNMSPTQMAEAMCKAKVYVDFGNHPGKDRIPRESAICGCCILTNREGSAANTEDVAILEQYKIEDTSESSVVLEKIYDLVDHYEERIEDYAFYRDKIHGEKAEFLYEVEATASILAEKVRSKNMKKTHGNSQCLQILDSISKAAGKVQELAEVSKELYCEEEYATATNKLLTMDYLLQVIRETIYAEIGEMVD